MDLETANALDTLTADIRRVETSLTGKIPQVETSLTGKINGVETSLNARIEGLETSLAAKMHELNDDTKRHVNVQIESVRDDIRKVAEHLVALGSKVDSFRR